jgi:hypothetical protein
MEDDGIYVENDAIADRIRATAELLRVAKGADSKSKAKAHELIDAVIETMRPKKAEPPVSLVHNYLSSAHKSQV